MIVYWKLHRSKEAGGEDNVWSVKDEAELTRLSVESIELCDTEVGRQINKLLNYCDYKLMFFALCILVNATDIFQE